MTKACIVMYVHVHVFFFLSAKTLKFGSLFKLIKKKTKSYTILDNFNSGILLVLCSQKRKSEQKKKLSQQENYSTKITIENKSIGYPRTFCP